MPEHKEPTISLEQKDLCETPQELLKSPKLAQVLKGFNDYKKGYQQRYEPQEPWKFVTVEDVVVFSIISGDFFA